jgi:peptide/nickel transport system substrate-binding protein
MTVRITTNGPFVPILSHLAHTATSILNERAVTEAGEDYGTSVVVGTGPFSFVSWEVASRSSSTATTTGGAATSAPSA